MSTTRYRVVAALLALSFLGITAVLALLVVSAPCPCWY